jgi:hypothetical protein
MRAKKPKIKEEDLVKRYQDLLEIARLVSWCMNRDHLIKTCLDHIGQGSGFDPECRDTLSGNTISGAPFGAI